MATDKQISGWLSEVDRVVKNQPESTWTIARLRFAYPRPGTKSLVQIDTATAFGAHAVALTARPFNTAVQRVEIHAVFSDFALRGKSSIIGPFGILLQKGRQAHGRFRQQYAETLWPMHGSWTVPFVLETTMGRLIPRPTDDEVILKSAAPGEFAMPPFGVWFEKWDPINLVLESEPEGPTIAVCEHAMHCMLNVGKAPATPEFYTP